MATPYFQGLDDWLADAIDAGTVFLGETARSAVRSLGMQGGTEVDPFAGPEEQAAQPGISGQGATTNVAAGVDAASQTAMPGVEDPTGPDYLQFGTGHSWPERRISYDPADVNSGNPGFNDAWFGIDDKSKFVRRDPKEARFLETEGLGGDATKYSRVDNGVYIGPLLVDKNNQISKDHPQAYVPDEAFSVIASFGSEEERFSFLKSLEAKGLYGGSEVSATGFDSQDLSAVTQLLLTANVMGRTWDVAYYHILSSGKYATIPGRGGGRGVTVRYTNPEDVKAVFQESAQRILGRAVDEDTLNQFVDTYRSMEEQGARGNVQAPAVSTAAEGQIKEQYGQERSAVGFSNLARIMDSLIRGGA